MDGWPCHAAGGRCKSSRNVNALLLFDKYLAHFGANDFLLALHTCKLSIGALWTIQPPSILLTISYPTTMMATSTSKCPAQGPKSEPERS